MSDPRERSPATSAEAKATPAETKAAPAVDLKLEIVVIPVSDVERAKQFYAKLGWRLDADFAGPDDYRVIQFTPPGSNASVIFGKNVTSAAPGSAQGLYLIVSDIEAARNALLGRGVAISEAFRVRLSGPDPARGSYRSYASFSDPDGNGWLLQEITARMPGRIDGSGTSFTSSADLAAAFRRAAAAHGEYEKRNGGKHDENWPDWYADYIVNEQHGQQQAA